MSSVTVCHACDLVQRRTAILGAARVRCSRCRAELYRSHGVNVDTATALAVTAAVLLVSSNVFPLVSLQLNGTYRVTTLLGAAGALYAEGYVPVAVLVAVTTVAVPALQIGGALYVLMPPRAGSGGLHRRTLLRWLGRVHPWAMPEVFMLGALVALVKLAAMARVVPGIALYSYGTLMLTLSALGSIAPHEQFWRWVKGARP